ncbi:hypothetical protein B0A50_01605 [Salinomyces thailandicus]|uniref:PH domain-containing protein n=1 Tax=Salinomyces thailandicus TaxID=706561 RepID=A0A4U0UBF0_9PEZI|nr:hypothetical protein B0A50_01605 [Salinomyces thailandica]
MAMSPFALSILGMESTSRRDDVVPGVIPPVREDRAARPRPARRATSNYNAFQTSCTPASDDPPSYSIATRHKLSTPTTRAGQEELPKYTSTVNDEAKMLLQLESMNPLHGTAQSEWREVYVVLCGTMLSFYRVKDGGPGRLLRSYTLQHAEVGLATDSSHTVLVPQTRLAHLIPSSARRKAWSKDSSLYKAAKQSILRIRIETDQIILAHASEDRICNLINAISAGIDISQSIDERTIPRQCTVPRRRRRQPRIPDSDDLNDPALIAYQERILREMFPTFAAQRVGQLAGATPQAAEAERAASRPDELQRTTTATSMDDAPVESTQGPMRDEDDLDFAVMREDFATPGASAPTQDRSSDPNRPAMSRQTTATSVSSVLSDSAIYATDPINFNPEGKWHPPHPRTAAQSQRYTRRCMPVLLAEAVRASDVLICNSRRIKINWRMELLEDWELSPPSYKSHGFKKASDPGQGGGLERTKSTSASSQAASSNDPGTSRSFLGREVDAGDQIERVESGVTNLELSKVNSATKETRAASRSSAQLQQMEAKRQEVRRGEDVHGVAFCF